ncbi:MAG: hypothetical protein JRM97_08920 [Nitrososphaerota archaeon]|nr:hypothetical protein [Nitrososphaerota archaeon]MDG7032736.1 hypothetical protein [Nitrososphaerota archaeon]
MDSAQKAAVAAALSVAVLGTAAYFLTRPKPPAQLSSITLSAASSKETLGQPDTVTAVAKSSSGAAVAGVPLYLFYAEPGTGWNLLSSSTTDAQGTATWEFTAETQGTYYLICSASASVSSLPSVPSAS